MTKETEEKRALEEKARLKAEASEHKKGANDKLREHDNHAENGPDGAQDKQPMPENRNVEAHAKPTSKPQNTFEAQGVDPENGVVEPKKAEKPAKKDNK